MHTPAAGFIAQGARLATLWQPALMPLRPPAGAQRQAAEADLRAASALVEDAFALAGLGFYPEPLWALQASAAAAASPAWQSGLGALLLGTPVLDGLAALWPMLSGSPNCTAGEPCALRCPAVQFVHAWAMDRGGCLPARLAWRPGVATLVQGVSASTAAWCSAAGGLRQTGCHAGLDAFTRNITAGSSRALQASAASDLDGSQDTFAGRLQAVRVIDLLCCI